MFKIGRHRKIQIVITLGLTVTSLGALVPGFQMEALVILSLVTNLVWVWEG